MNNIKREIKSHPVSKKGRDRHESDEDENIEKVLSGKKSKTLSHPNKKDVERSKDADINDISFDMAYKFFMENKKETRCDSDNENECKHLNTIDEDGNIICVDCGESFDTLNVCEEAEWRYYGAGDNVETSDPSRCQYRKVVDKGITKELTAMGFSVDVTQKANQLYLMVTKDNIKRSNFRRGIMFACVFHAFIELDRPQTTEYIQKIFKNISKRNISKGFTYYGIEMPKNKREKYVYITAEHYIPKILNLLKVTDEHISNVLELYNKLKEKSYLLNTSNPQSIGSGFVYYYLKKINKKNDFEINPSVFGKIVNLSEITISRIANEIEDIMNSNDNVF